MKKRVKNMAASVRQHLLDLARERGEDFQFVLTRYAIERFLYRLSRSRYGDRFVLKGAILFVVWTGTPYRTTRDLDLLGKGEPSVPALQDIFRAVCRVKAEPDGIEFPPETVSAVEIRTTQDYGGVRVTMTARLAGARIPLQVDVGFGDAITPRPRRIVFPSLLGFPAARIAAYPPETVIAEKLQAMVMLGIANSRMKDFFDLWVLARNMSLDGDVLRRAIRATFGRRATEIPEERPVAFTPTFSGDPAKQVQWRAFVRRTGLAVDVPLFLDVMKDLVAFLEPPLRAAAQPGPFEKTRPPGGPWQDKL